MKINTILIIYNISDTIGRFMPTYYRISEKTLEQGVLFRIILCVIVGIFYTIFRFYLINIIVVTIISIVIIVLFSFINGYLSSLCFALAPSKAEKELKGKAASCMSLGWSSGIFLGSLYSLLVTKNLINLT